MAQPYKRSLIPVVNRRFQYKYTAIIIGIAGVVSAVLGALLLNSYWEMNRIIDLAMESPEISNKVDIDQALRVFHISIAFLVIEVLALGVMGLLICVFGVLLAAFFLMLDFEAIKQGIALGAPERESWRMAFGLLVTLVWIYLEFLRLIAIFSRN